MFEFVIDATSGAARVSSLNLPHGVVETPVFMPVGTQGTVRALSPNDLRAAGATLVLANTYHLHVRPGEQVVATLGALHRFMGWDRPLLTDSGGFQVFSLEGFRRVDDDGVEFQSHVDGGRRRLTNSTPSSSTRSEDTRLNSSHGYISYAVFCLKKKKKKNIHPMASIDNDTNYINSDVD